MNLRRRKGATLGLVAVCVMVIVVIGIGVYFLAKILGGGREVANATDAGALNVAKKSVLLSTPAPPEFKEFEYPGPGAGITLLTYNRCVAKVMIVAMNAKTIGGSAPGNVVTLIQKLDLVGPKLLGKLLGNTKFDEASTLNQHRLINQNQAVTSVGGVVADKAYMKPKGATNVFFSTNVSANGLTVPKAVSTKVPLNNPPLAANPNAFYMAGYEPITLATGQSIYGTPVFPQVTPHLVSLADFDQPAPAHGTAPPNAFKSDSSVQEQKTNLFTGAVACAIVGAINSGGSNNGSIGNGFEFPGALPYGFIEIQNLAANPQPPGYDEFAYDTNIFNNWLAKDTYVLGDNPGGKSQNSTNLLFGHDDPSVQAWANWANGMGPLPPNAASTSNQAVFFQFPGASIPVQLTQANSASYKANMAKIKMPSGTFNCYQQLSDPNTNYALAGACVPGAAAITTLSGEQFPVNPPPNSGQNFSNVDQVKAQVLVAFSDKGTAPNKPWSVTASPLVNTGLGVYADFYGNATPYPMPSPAPIMAVPTPQYKMPLQRIGNVWQLLNQVGAAKLCGRTTTLDDLVLRCQEIQPKTLRSDVIALLQSPTAQLPMAPARSGTKTKLYIYLPNGDLSKPLQIDGATPPGFGLVGGLVGGANPDGVDPSDPMAFPGPACQYNKYFIQDTIVNARAKTPADWGDELVHIAPYIDDNPPIGPNAMYAYDWAHWWPGSGANNNLGRLWFENGAYGDVNFSHIN